MKRTKLNLCEDATIQEHDDSGCVEDSSIYEKDFRRPMQLLDFSDDVLLYILKHCSALDLKALGFTCLRLAALVCDRTLWQNVEARDTRTGQSRLRWLLTHCLCKDTKAIRLKGYVNTDEKCLGLRDSHRTFCRQELEGFGTLPLGMGQGLRMWYPHLPRFTVSPRWPDMNELNDVPDGRRNSRRLPRISKQCAGVRNSMLLNNSKLVGTSGDDISTGVEKSQDSKSEDDKDDTPEMNKDSRQATARNSDANNLLNGFVMDPDWVLNKPSSSKQSGSGSILQAVSTSTVPLSMWNGGTACPGPQYTLSEPILRDLRETCIQLTILHLEFCNIDYKSNNTSQFPKTLKKLSLKGTRCYNQPLHSSYLCKIQDHLPDLEYLDVSYCDWFEPASLMPLSKVRKLEQLHMRQCMRFTECVAYASLAARYGFRKLRVLDARECPLSDSEISAMGWLPLLEELYVSPPPELPPPTEHSHLLLDLLPVFQELSPWELEEPEYFKCKSSNGPQMKDAVVQVNEEILKDTNETAVVTPAIDDSLDDQWAPPLCERRIIVIEPNSNRDMVIRSNDLPILPLWPPWPVPPEREAGPSKRRNDAEANDNAPMNLVKRARLHEDPDEEPDEELEEPNNDMFAETAHDESLERHRYYNLVTDAAVLRFGRSDLEHVVHIGPLMPDPDQSRPDRSNLRVLSLTGFRNITDKSLMHLSSSAPHLRLVDMSETSVTKNGVDTFKAILTNCEVKYSKFCKILIA